MKKILLPLLALAAAVAINFSCKDKITVTNLNPSNSYCADTLCWNQSGADLSGIIPVNIASILAERYRADAGKKYICNGDEITTIEDATSVWFDIEVLKSYITWVEKTVCRSGCADSLKLGIRVWFGKYPAIVGPGSSYDAFKTLPSEYGDHHTVFFMPTYKAGTNMIDFDPRDIGNNCIPNAIDKFKAVVFTLTGDLVTGADGQNHGGLRPPPAGSGEFPAEN